MQELATSVTTPAWWFSAVFVALLINLAAAYVKPWLDARMSRLSEIWRDRSAKSQETYLRAVADAVESPHTLQSLSDDEFRSRANTIVFLLLALIIMLYPLLAQSRAEATTLLDKLPETFFLLAKVVPLTYVLIEHKCAMAKASIIRGARKTLATREHKATD